MSQNRTFQLMYQSFYFALAIMGFLGSIHFFNHEFRWDFYILFTNISNYLCAGIMFAELVQTAKKTGDSYVTLNPALKFVGMLGIVLTFVVFNALLAHQPGRDPAKNYTVGCVLEHVALPILYVGDWFLFYERRRVKWYYPLLSTLFPIAYLCFIYVHARILHFDTDIRNFTGKDPLIYPYFFLNPDSVGVYGVVKWCITLFVCFIVVGYLFLITDKMIPGSKGLKLMTAKQKE